MLEVGSLVKLIVVIAKLLVAGALVVLCQLFVHPPLWTGFFLSVPLVPVPLVALWISVPNFLTYGVAGSLAATTFPCGAHYCSLLLFVCVATVYGFQYSGGVWVDGTAASLMNAYLPLVSAIAGYAVGIAVIWRGRKALRGGKSGG
jgi:hypothetical protein